jgi:aspartate racemase
VADFLVVTANVPHAHQEEIEAAAGCKILSMIDGTLAEVAHLGWGKVGLIGLFVPDVYFEPLQRLGVAYEILAPDERSELDRAILAFMAGQKGEASMAIARKAIDDLWAKDVEGIILGCTEIPLLLEQVSAGEGLINPAQLLAEAAVRFAIE